MCRINPKVDLVFKKLFGSEENKDILLSLVNSLLPGDQQLVRLHLKNPYNLADYINGKLSILDIKAVDEQDRWYDIEMQVDALDYYGQKALFYWGKVFTGQIEAGELYSRLNKTIVISILDFVYFPGAERYHRVVSPRDTVTHEAYEGLDYMDLHFVELKKFKKDLKDLRTTLDRWITFLNNAYMYEKDRIPGELAGDKEVKKAIERLDVMYLSEKEREYYEAEQKALRDRTGALLTAERKGEHNRTLEMARQMKAEGIDADVIARVSGLSPGDIREL